MPDPSDVSLIDVGESGESATEARAPRLPTPNERAIQVLIVEDSQDDALLVDRALASGGLHVEAERVDTGETMAAVLERQAWDVVISDCALPGFSALQALQITQSRRPDTPFVVVSGTIGEEAAAALMKAGAHDYVSKGNLARLAQVVVRAMGDARTRLAHRVAEARIRRMAFYDTVTELPNRNLLFGRMQQMLQAPGHRLALLFVELVGLSDVRKTLGASGSDAMLRTAAERFKAVVEPQGVVAVLGADRFGIVSPEIGDTQAERIAEALVASLRTPLDAESSLVRASCHVGIALAPGHGSTGVALLRRAEIAATYAHRVSQPFFVYSPEFDIYSKRRLELLNALWQAGERKELELLYQPKVNIQRGTVTAVEALVRWNRPGLGTLLPDEFIPLSEDFGSIRHVTAWVVDEALRQCAAWRHTGLNLSVAVNLPGSGLQDGKIVDWLSSELARHGLPGSALEVEVTEGSLIRDPVAARRTLTRLRALGVRSAIDDFGAGYSSLAYLRNLPVHALKIDKSFLSGGLRDPRDESIVRSTIALAHNLSMDVVAEGVEEESALACLRQHGCDGAQGYFIAHPMPAPAVRPWLKEAYWMVSRP